VFLEVLFHEVSTFISLWGPTIRTLTKEMDKKKSQIDDAMHGNGSVFGHVLANYLEYQPHATREDQMLPEVFIRKYLGIASLESYTYLYRFEDSQVHSIVMVLGNYKGSERATHLRDSGGTKLWFAASQRHSSPTLGVVISWTSGKAMAAPFILVRRRSPYYSANKFCRKLKAGKFC
jgi:hypothetical protein